MIDKLVNTTGLKFPSKYLSNSQITTYVLCPMSYKFSYVDGLKEPPNPFLITGRAAHNILEIFSEFNNYEFDAVELEENFKMIFEKEMQDVPTNLKTKEKMVEFIDAKDKILPSLKLYCKDVLPKLNVIAKEIEVSKPIPIYEQYVDFIGDLKKKIVRKELLGEVSFVGYIDFIRSKSKTKATMIKTAHYEDELFSNKKDVQVGDYKTGARKDATFFNNDLQLPFYSYATGIKETRIDNIVKSKMGYKKDGTLRKDAVLPSYSVLHNTVKDSQISMMLEQYSTVALGIAKGVFPRCHESYWKCSESNCLHWKYCRGKKLS